GVRGLRCRVPVSRGRVSAEGEAGRDERGEGERLQEARQLLRATPQAYAAPLQDGEGDGHRRRDQQLATGERRQEHARVLAYDERDRGDRAARREPVAPPDDEAGVLA